MKDYQSPNHTRRDCKYHVVFIPKRCKRGVYGSIRKHLAKVFHELAKQKESTIMEGHLRPDHIHMCVHNAEDARLEQHNMLHNETPPSGGS
jgi:putative transposase